jgi:hypothetical protein
VIRPRRRTRAALAVALATLACARRGASPARSEPGFPLRIDRARLDGDTLVVEYVLTNDARDAVWVACPAPACGHPALVSGRFDGLGSDRATVQVSSRVAPEGSTAASASSPERVPFRRVPPGESRWEARYVLPGPLPAGARAVELAVGVLPCPDPEFLPALRRLDIACSDPLRRTECERLRRALPADGIRFATRRERCGGREVEVVELQRLSRARRSLDDVPRTPPR